MTGHIKPARLVDLKHGEPATVGDIAALIATVDDYWRMLANLSDMDQRGYKIEKPSGDQVDLTPEAIESHEHDYAERCQEASDQAYYGGE